MAKISDSFTIRRRDGSEHVVLYSPEDEDLVRSHTWGLTNGYATTCIPNGDGTHYRLYMHRAVLGAANKHGHEAVGDHINGIRLDNRRSNLRLTDCSQNALNRKNGRHGYVPIDMDQPIGYP